MKRTILVSIIFAITIFTAHSQTKQELIRELIHLTQTDSMMEKTYKSIVPTFMKQISTETNDSSKLAITQDFMNSMILSGKEISRKIMDEDIAGLYEKYYTENEIKDIIVFYKSTTGQKLIKKMPEMQKEIMTIMMQKFMPEIKKNVTEMVMKMKDKQHK
jgi:hypothetical protein